jgi:iron complex transport system permease protein
LYFVLGSVLKFHAGEWTLPIAACLGGAAATALVFLISETASPNRESTTSLLLIGIAINALFLSGVGFLSYIARDPQARSITFWSLGTLIGIVTSAVGAPVFIALLRGREYRF